jgi:hypothetical protein
MPQAIAKSIDKQLACLHSSIAAQLYLCMEGIFRYADEKTLLINLRQESSAVCSKDTAYTIYKQ